ncbi:MAG: hypothetical protein Pg6B_09840 [Candidatus Azobacteroides pseudotrichonymphae]|nr:MAG: hypothetical protein Pg6B_09840 [Candidatus Azobacteroides pseudotrichonymphae]
MCLSDILQVLIGLLLNESRSDEQYKFDVIVFLSILSVLILFNISLSVEKN